jgi:hypothetical protein
VTRWLPRTAEIASFRSFPLIFRSLNSCCPNLLSEENACSICSTETNSSPYSFLWFLAPSKIDTKLEPIIGPLVSPETYQTKKHLKVQTYTINQNHYSLCKEKLLYYTFGCREINSSVACRTDVLSSPAFDNILRANPSFCSRRAFMRCSASTICCLDNLAASTAPTMPSQAISVNSPGAICLLGNN